MFVVETFNSAGFIHYKAVKFNHIIVSGYLAVGNEGQPLFPAGCQLRIEECSDGIFNYVEDHFPEQSRRNDLCFFV